MYAMRTTPLEVGTTSNTNNLMSKSGVVSCVGMSNFGRFYKY